MKRDQYEWNDLRRIIKKNDQKLTELNLYDYGITGRKMITLSDAFRSNHTITKLVLSKNPLDYNGYVAIGNLIRRTRVLQQLHLNFNHLSEDILKELAKAMEFNFSMQSLVMSDYDDRCQFYDEIKSFLDRNKKISSFIKELIYRVEDNDESLTGIDLTDLSLELQYLILKLMQENKKITAITLYVRNFSQLENMLPLLAVLPNQVQKITLKISFSRTEETIKIMRNAQNIMPVRFSWEIIFTRQGQQELYRWLNKIIHNTNNSKVELVGEQLNEFLAFCDSDDNLNLLAGFEEILTRIPESFFANKFLEMPQKINTLLAGDCGKDPMSISRLNAIIDKMRQVLRDKVPGEIDAYKLYFIAQRIKSLQNTITSLITKYIHCLHLTPFLLENILKNKLIKLDEGVLRTLMSTHASSFFYINFHTLFGLAQQFPRYKNSIFSAALSDPDALDEFIAQYKQFQYRISSEKDRNFLESMCAKPRELVCATQSVQTPLNIQTKDITCVWYEAHSSQDDKKYRNDLYFVENIYILNERISIGCQSDYAAYISGTQRRLTLAFKALGFSDSNLIWCVEYKDDRIEKFLTVVDQFAPLGDLKTKIMELVKEKKQTLLLQANNNNNNCSSERSHKTQQESHNDDAQLSSLIKTTKHPIYSNTKDTLGKDGKKEEEEKQECVSSTEFLSN